MSTEPQLHSSIVALVSLASGIAAKHPAMGLCQLEKLRSLGIPESQINTVIEIARHIRDEAAEKLDTAFDEKAGINTTTTACCPSSNDVDKTDNTDNTENNDTGCCGTTDTKTKEPEAESCCSSTPSGQSCC